MKYRSFSWESLTHGDELVACGGYTPPFALWHHEYGQAIKKTAVWFFLSHSFLNHFSYVIFSSQYDKSNDKEHSCLLL